MNTAVRYVSRGGNTEKVARAIASALGMTAVSIDSPGGSVINEETDLLFLGTGVYGFDIDKTVASFIQNLDGGKVKKVAVFSTTALIKSARPYIEKLLSPKGIPLAEEEFHCWGKFLCARLGRPSSADLEKAAAFAKKITA